MTKDGPEDAAAYNYTPRCLVCAGTLDVRRAQGRRSGKPFVMLVCPHDGRHFRAFVRHEPFVQGILERLEGKVTAVPAEDDPTGSRSGSRRSKTKLERAGGP